MKTYRIYAPSSSDPTSLNPAENVKFVKEGYSFLAAIFGPFWLLAKQMWFEALGYFAGLIIVLNILSFFGLNEIGSTALLYLVSAIFGLFANDIEAQHLEQKGYDMAAIVTGSSYELCEAKYFQSLSVQGTQNGADT